VKIGPQLMGSSGIGRSLPSAGRATAEALPTPPRVGRFRWVICALLLLGVTKNYMDRQVLGVLKTTLQHDLGWNEVDYGRVVFAFQAAYGFGLLIAGRFIDRVGTRLGYSLAMVCWSLASMAHGVAGSLGGFEVARAALGLSEAGVFPASIKAVAEWFPARERALAAGIFNAGTNLGAIITPLTVPWVVIHWGWRWAFLLTGGLGFFWLILWVAVYRKPEEHPRLSPAELDYIRSDPPAPAARISWKRLGLHRQTWAFVLGKFLTDPIWWFYLFWAPDFLQRNHGLRLAQIGIPVMVIYVISDAGSVAGGWLSSRLIYRGRTVNWARKGAMLVCALSAIPVIYASRARGMWTAVLLIGVAAAGHQGFSANLFTLVSDMFPGPAVASVTGLGGMAGAVGGMLIAKFVGWVLQSTGSYRLPFLMAGSAYLVALGVIHLLAPRLAPVRLMSGSGG
jgi:ACS family hexuronate transporter-like MFS transporter